MKIFDLFRKAKTRFMSLILPKAKYAQYLGVNIGKNCLISTCKWSTEPYLITIGNNVQVTKDVYFHTHGGAHVARKKYPSFDVFGKIVVEDWAYIGSGSHIMPGVTIGEGALIAACSVVTKSVAKGTVVGGNPARYICDVEEYVKKNMKFDVKAKELSEKEKKSFLLSLPQEKFIQK